MPDVPIPLAAGFPAPDREAWVALVEKTLKGASLDSLVRRTADSIEVQPLYAPSDAPALPSWRARTGDLAWDVRTEVRIGDPAAANTAILDDLAGGASSVLLQVTRPEALERALEGVTLEAATVALDAGFLGPKAADALSTLAKASPGARLAFHMDPLSAFARSGVSAGPIDAHLISAATVAARLAETYPKAGLMLASGRVAHEAGGSDATELAVALAAALAYARTLVRAGLSMSAAFGGIILGLTADAEYFPAVAKLRAGRALWARLTDACGAPTPAKLEVRASSRMLTRADAWTNLIRLTAAGFAAAVGGADAVILPAFTEPLGAPTAFARRQARNTQLVLMEEAHIGQVADPAAGCGYVEALTDALAHDAWARFQAIEAAGGLARALESGLITGQVSAARQALSADLAEGRRKLLGVTDFKPADDTPPEVAASVTGTTPEVRLPGPDGACPALTPWRLEEALA